MPPQLPENIQTPPISSPVPKPKRSKKLVFIVLTILILLSAIGVSSYIFIPKYFTTQYVAKIKPSVTGLKESTADINNIIGQMYATINNTQNPALPGELKVSGLLIHPEVALLIGSGIPQNSNVLGAYAIAPGMIEQSALSFSQNSKGSLANINKASSKVAAATKTPADLLDAQLREVKDESQAVNDKVAKAQQELVTALNAQSDKPLMLTDEAKNKVVKDISLEQNVKPYVDKSSKISKYYEVLSGTIITMNSEIASFKTALSSAATSFAKLNSSSSDLTTFQSSLSQTQIYLDQAKKNSEKIKQLAETLTNLPKDQLPTGSEKYHEHNIKVINTVTKYFDVESKTFQTFIDGSNVLLTKINSGSATTVDLTSYKSIISIGTQDSKLADTQFAAELQALVGEEKTLTLDFWQNSQIFDKSKKVQDQLNNLINNLNSLH